MVTGLNHLTLAVKNLQRSIGFYTEILEFQIRRQTDHSCYLEAGILWLALVEEEADDFEVVANGYSHVAFSVDVVKFPEAKKKLSDAGVKVWQHSDTDSSFYFLDPDGYQLEIHTGDLESRLSTFSAKK
ncbi:MAG: VOC family protein [Verrucomicrobiota bacterium]